MAGPIHSFNSINLLFRMGRLIENWIGMKGQRPQENSPAHEMGCCSRGDWFVNGICFLFLSFWWVKGGCWPHCSAKKREQNKKQMEWSPPFLFLHQLRWLKRKREELNGFDLSFSLCGGLWAGTAAIRSAKREKTKTNQIQIQQTIQHSFLHQQNQTFLICVEWRED